MGLAFVPFYIRHLGAEAYGLIGVFAVLQSCMSLLDLGLTPTLNREMARLRAGAHTTDSIRDLLRSLEMIYAGLAVLVIAIVWFSAAWLANGWLHGEGLSQTQVADAIKIMGFVLATRWLEQVYRGALQGMQDQVWLNAVLAALATLRWGGAYLVVAFGSSTISAFFVWQGAVSLTTTAVLVHRTYRVLPVPQRRAVFSISALKEVYGFASGMFISAGLTLLLTQADKLVISKILPLAQLGHYMLAATAAGGLLQLVLPMNTAVYPRLTELVARKDVVALAVTYQRSCEWMAAVIVPPALLLAFFAQPALLLWTGDSHLADAAAPALSLLALGTLFNGLMNLPYMLQLAHGWTTLSVQVNALAVIVMAPAIIWAVPRFGPTGAACAWMVLNLVYVLVVAPLLYRRLLPAANWPWYAHAVAWPLAAGAVPAAAIHWLSPVASSRTHAGALIALTATVLTACVACSLPAVRATLRQSVNAARRAMQ
jgi:O-antigen/teichoic acid export membrane protein